MGADHNEFWHKVQLIKIGLAECKKYQNAEKQKARSKAGFLNLAPLTGITFASNWLINKLNLNPLPVKTTRMTPLPTS
ncbi:hypothetical protein ACM26M_12360 [Kluyvera cryocrescens]|uniref:hypothetical protein n=1 Tax=Kluyvera cryocrescens TaxID=580 RepID=UPI0039F706C2